MTERVVERADIGVEESLRDFRGLGALPDKPIEHQDHVKAVLLEPPLHRVGCPQGRIQVWSPGLGDTSGVKPLAGFLRRSLFEKSHLGLDFAPDCA